MVTSTSNKKKSKVTFLSKYQFLFSNTNSNFGIRSFVTSFDKVLHSESQVIMVIVFVLQTRNLTVCKLLVKRDMNVCH